MDKCHSCQKEVSEEFKFCPYCGVKLTEMECPECGYVNEPNSKFCQECGARLENGQTIAQKQKVKPESVTVAEIIEPVPAYGITIEFPYSSSQSFDFAIQEARKFESFKQFGEAKKAVYRVTVYDNEIETLDGLIEFMKGWRNRTVYVKGEKVMWDTVFSYTWCYNQRKKSFKPELYCFGYENEWEFNLWGCIQTRLSFNENSELFTFGKWLNNSGDWGFDKERIRHALEKNAFQMRFCPVIQLGLIEEVLNAFPEKVNPFKDGNWKFIENWGEETGLAVKEKRFGSIETVYMKGVAPKDKAVLMKDISKRIKTRLPEKLF